MSPSRMGVWSEAEEARRGYVESRAQDAHLRDGLRFEARQSRK